MKKLTKTLSLAICLSAAVLTGCAGSNGAEATAEAIVVSGVSKGAANEQMLELFRQQPEFKAMVSCIAQSLDGQGWSGSDHDAYMEATGRTGDLSKIDKSQYSESELMEQFGAIFMASGDCM